MAIEHEGHAVPGAAPLSPAAGANSASRDGNAPAASPAGRERRDRDARLAQAFAQITAVLMRDPSFGNLRLAELEWLLLPPLLAGQWRVARSGVEPRSAAAGPGPASGGMLVPVGVALWARVSPAVDKRLSEGLDKPLLLKAPEWSSGDINWLIATAGDGRVMPRFLKMLHEREFKGREVKLRARAKDGSLVVRTLAEHVSTL